MNRRTYYSLIALLLLVTSCMTSNSCLELSMYNEVWRESSKDASESMPVGGGDIGCNVWVEDGDLLFYMQRSGSMSEVGEYLKLGRVRVKLTPNPLKEYDDFVQELHLEQGYVDISSSKGDLNLRVKMWVDIFTNSIHLKFSANRDIDLKATYESWRTEDRPFTDKNRERTSSYSLEEYPGELIKRGDNVCFSGDNGVIFYHHNGEDTPSPNVMIEQQGLTEFASEITNINKNRMIGGKMFGENLRKGDIEEGRYITTDFRGWSLESIEPQKEFHLIIATYIDQISDVKGGVKEIERAATTAGSKLGSEARNSKWWEDFWNRSWIITSTPEDSLTWQMGKNYQLFRYQLGCNEFGTFPTKFNGGNFTYDPYLTQNSTPNDPDWRAWGGDVFTAQNQRLVYWPMLKSGDFEAVKPQLELFVKGLPGAKLRVKHFFGHEGALFCEYSNMAGLAIGSGYGWSSAPNRERGIDVPFGDSLINGLGGYKDPVEAGVMGNGFISYHWESQVEHAYMALELHRYSGKNIDYYLPFIKSALIFFDEHYQKRNVIRSGEPLNEDGKLVIFPSTSCESYRGALNPTDLISGIRSSLESIVALQSELISDGEREYFSSYLERLPELSYGEVEGDRVVLPAESYLKYQNVECPQFYPLFPFNRFDLQSDEIESFKNSWEHGIFPKNMVISWHQDGIFFARMGMVEEAMEYNQQKLKDSPRRFPTFWGPGHDWTPDHNWGGTGMLGLQEMLLQTVGDKIHIFPAWPKDKDVSFKLHAPHSTTVEVVYKNQKIEKLVVTPSKRVKDIIMW